MTQHTRIAARLALAAIYLFWGSAHADPNFPRTAADPAAIVRGQQIYSVNCGFCHGSSARGGEKGPNLLRSPLVMADQKGELVAGVVLTGRPDKGMPRFNLPVEEVADIAAFLHSFDVSGTVEKPVDPNRVLIGNAAAGKAYFNGEGGCTACHSIKGDLKGIGSHYDPQHLQDMIFTAGGTGLSGEPSPTAPPIRVRVEEPSGEVKGQLVELDEFFIVLIDDSGARRSLRREGDTPRIQLENPLQAHLDRVRRWEDRDLHNVTAYLATLK